MGSLSKILLGVIGVIAAAGVFYVARGDDAPADAPLAQGAPIVNVVVPERLTDAETIGANVFASFCAECHGDNAAGRNGSGPPLVHKIYEPSHHGDFAFLNAAQNGVRSHHWPFGDMPPVEGVNRAEVAAVVAYVRALQRANGIQ